jgi:hypothetical protein
MSELQQQNEYFLSRQEQQRFSLPVSWVLGATSVCLIAGFLSGLWWIDYRSRKRHGGFRIR